jgi:hypothetical protein
MGFSPLVAMLGQIHELRTLFLQDLLHRVALVCRTAIRGFPKSRSRLSILSGLAAINLAISPKYITYMPIMF